MRKALIRSFLLLACLGAGTSIWSCSGGGGKSSNGSGDGGGGGDGGDGGATGQVRVTAKALASGASFTNLRAQALKEFSGNLGIQTISNPTGDEYEGMGVNAGAAVVEGLKIQLTSITFGGIPGGGGLSSTVYDWSAAPKEIDISGVVNESIAETATINVGSYETVSVSFKARYNIKAYAYISSGTDPDVVDQTVFTKATGVVVEQRIIAPGDLAAEGYDFYEYPFMFISCSDSPTNSTTECGTMSLLPEPITIEEGAVTNVTLFVDGSSIVRAWDGSGADVPSSDPTNTWGLRQSDYLPFDEPNFSLSYIPAFAFANVTSVSSQVYEIGEDSDNTMHSDSDGSRLILVLDDDGKPLLGMTTLGASYAIGSVARLIEETAPNTYKWYGDYRMTDDAGNNDGGLYYNNDPDMAGFIITDFSLLPNVGDSSSMVVNDGPRCNGEYNLCYGPRNHPVKRVQ